MLKKYSQVFVSLLFVVDMLIVIGSWLFAYGVRFYFFPFPPPIIPPFLPYAWLLFFIVPIWAMSFKLFGLYQPWRGKRKILEFVDIFKASLFSLLILLAVAFFERRASYSRLTIIYFSIFQIVITGIFRGAIRKGLQVLRSRGYNLRWILIVGAGPVGQSLLEKIELHPEMGFQVVGFLDEDPTRVGSFVKGKPILGSLDSLAKVTEEKAVDQVFITLPLNSYERLEDLINSLWEGVADVKIIPDFLHFMKLNAGIEEFEGLPIIRLSEGPMVGWNRVIKRVIDVICATIALLLFAPLMVVIALLIKLTSPGSVFYRQERVGLDGKPFIIYKFRTMGVDAEEETGAVWATPDDERRTKLGAFLRRTSFDETPQFFNVLKGEMSLVGPRPERPIFVEQFRKSIPQYMLRHKVKSGITGWAQVNGWRGNTSLEKRIEYDLYYIEHWSLFFDLKIIWLTIWRGFINEHAY
ncbi:MAG: undecaprenyl-phosphate glucose phosphotransferase [Candidatus Tectomicrobia bacterium]|nr:undecaprenyl-phosphate glucose phosphotransferase [Candidatus Tectomicrobia bacterium]